MDAVHTRLSACAGCHGALYCSVACQRAHWVAHKGRCRARKAEGNPAATLELQRAVIAGVTDASRYAALLRAGAQPHARITALAGGVEGGAGAIAANATHVICSTINGAGAFQHAALMGNDAALRAMIKAGADVDAKPGDGYSALDYAAENAHVSSVRLLLETASQAGAEAALAKLRRCLPEDGPRPSRRDADARATIGRLLAARAAAAAAAQTVSELD